MSNISTPPDRAPDAARSLKLGPTEPSSFEAPWQATVFALLIGLVEARRLSWREWGEAFSAELKRHPSDLGQTDYFDCWTRALQRLLVGKGLLGDDELEAVARAISHTHDHGAAGTRQ